MAGRQIRAFPARVLKARVIEPKPPPNGIGGADAENGLVFFGGEGDSISTYSPCSTERRAFEMRRADSRPLWNDAKKFSGRHIARMRCAERRHKGKRRHCSNNSDYAVFSRELYCSRTHMPSWLHQPPLHVISEARNFWPALSKLGLSSTETVALAPLPVRRVSVQAPALALGISTQ
jgi:hypothetical protein